MVKISSQSDRQNIRHCVRTWNKQRSGPTWMFSCFFPLIPADTSHYPEGNAEPQDSVVFDVKSLHISLRHPIRFTLSKYDC